MKKKKLFILFIVMILITGCVKYDLKMQVNTDKSFTLVLINAMQKEYYNSNGDNQSEIDEYKELGFEVENYSDSEYSGLKLTKKYNSIDDISSPTCQTVELTNILEENTDELVLFKSSKTGTLTTYTADFTYDLTQEEMTDSESIDYSENTEGMYFGYTITLPKNSNILSNNADIVTNDGYTLTWKMEYGKLKDIDFVFTIDDQAVTKTPEEDINDDETKTEETESKEEIIKEEKEEELQVNFSFSSIIALIVIIGVIAGIIYLKIKLSSHSRFNKKKANDPSVLYHSTPPNNREHK